MAGDMSIQDQALAELKVQSREEAVSYAKKLICEIAQEQHRIKFSQDRIEEHKKTLAAIQVTEYSI